MQPDTGIFITKQFILATFSITKKFSFVVLAAAHAAVSSTAPLG
jgi:hypothetical protein